MEHSKRGAGATSNIQEMSTLEDPRENGIPSNIQEVKPSKFPQEPAIGNDTGPEMRSIVCPNGVPDEPDVGQQEKDDDRWCKQFRVTVTHAHKTHAHTHTLCVAVDALI